MDAADFDAAIQEFVEGEDASSPRLLLPPEPAAPALDDPKPKRIDEMTLADYRRGVAKVMARPVI